MNESRHDAGRPCGRAMAAVAAGLCLALAACGGGGGGGGNDQPPDVPDPTPPPISESAFVTTTDFVTGSYSTINLVDGRTATDLPGETGIVEADNGAVYFGNRVYILNRFGFDNISVVETAAPEAVVKQFSTGNGSNPQDMVFLREDRAYVSLYGSNDLLIVDPTAATGREIRGAIDLSVFLDPDDEDGLVEAAAMARVGRYVFVSLQRLSNFASQTNGVLAVIDTETDTLVDTDPDSAGLQALALAGQNPVALEYAADLGRLLVSVAGTFGVNDGGIEAVDPFRFKSEGLLIGEAALGGDAGPLASVAGIKVYVVAGGFSANGIKVFDLSLDPSKGTLSASDPRDLGLDLPFVPSLAVDGARMLLVPDRTLEAPGVRLVDTFSDSVTSAIDVGLPPNIVLVAPPTPPTVFVSTTDFVTGSYSTVDLESGAADSDLPDQTGIAEADNSAVYFNNRVYVLNRFGFDNISVLETEDLSTAARQFSTGNGSNPQDMAFVSDSKAYVSLYGSNDLLIVDPTATVGNEITGSIDLSEYLAPDDADGLVEAAAMAKVGRYLFVALQQLSDFEIITNGVLAVIDTETDSLVDVDAAAAGIQPIVLLASNPVAVSYAPGLGRLLVSSAGRFGIEDGGIETVDPFLFASEGILVSESELGGDVGPTVSADGRKVYVAAGGFSENGVRAIDVELNPSTGIFEGAIPRDLGLALPFIPSLAIDGAGRLIVPDRSLEAPGLRFIDSFSDDELTTSPIDVGLPPNAIVVLYP